MSVQQVDNKMSKLSSQYSIWHNNDLMINLMGAGYVLVYMVCVGFRTWYHENFSSHGILFIMHMFVQNLLFAHSNWNADLFFIYLFFFLKLNHFLGAILFMYAIDYFQCRNLHLILTNLKILFWSNRTLKIR